MIRVEANAKINPALDIVGKTENGYHELSMLMQELKLHDHVELERIPASDIAARLGDAAAGACGPVFLTVIGEEKDVPEDERNLAMKAARLMMNTFGLKDGLKIHLSKRIPAGAGLGGGSSDAAAVIRGIDYLFGLNLSAEKMKELALQLGADVPFFIQGGTQLAEGIGEKLTRLPKLPKLPVLLIMPKENASTREVYEAFDALKEVKHPEVSALTEAVKALAPIAEKAAGNEHLDALFENKEEINAFLKQLKEDSGNVLEEVTGKQFPIIGDLEKLLYQNGAGFAMMSGSGPCVFGLFSDKETMEKAASAVQKHFEQLPEENCPQIICTTLR